jgi:hypothetical protein
MIERKIIIGLITSTDYIRQVRRVWDPHYLESSAAKRLASWVWEYFEKYDKAPGKDIEGIFFEKIKSNRIAKDVAEEIEEDILPGLSQEYENTSFNLNYLLDQTFRYFKERQLALLSETVQSLLDKGELEQAEKIACDFKPVTDISETELDLGNEIVLDRIDKAFDITSECLIEYPAHLGEFMNDQLVRGGFVAVMATEKRGKTFILMDFAMKACKQGRNVAFFSAGDMTEDEMLLRICIYLTGKSNERKYCSQMWEPVKDCIHNQLNTCNRKERECGFGVFEDWEEKDLRGKVQAKDLIEAYNSNKDYRPCTNCHEYKTHHWGAVWVRDIPEAEPLTKEEAKKAARQFFLKHNRHFKLSTHANDTLSVPQIESFLDVWEKAEGFVPDVVIIDYADLLITESNIEFRHQQNRIWKGLRRISQKKHCLVITATQTDADSYEQDRLRMKNFSEDKRKYAHVTVMYGLNQDTKGREKKIGLMRINEIVKRKGDSSELNEITILQNLKRGKPFIGSYW